MVKFGDMVHTFAGLNFITWKLERNYEVNNLRLGNVWRVVIDVDLLHHVCSNETNYREHTLSKVYKLDGNEFILTHDDDGLFLPLYGYAFDSFCIILRKFLKNIEFPAATTDNLKGDIIISSSDIDNDNLMPAFCGFCERYLVAKILWRWYFINNLRDIAAEYAAECSDLELDISKILCGDNINCVRINELGL